VVGMPELNLETVTRTAAAVAFAQSFPISVVGSVPSSGGSRYVEILFRVEGSAEEPCHLQLGVFRDAGVENLREQITDQIARHLARRRS
jgi:hypothetical protein